MRLSARFVEVTIALVALSFLGIFSAREYLDVAFELPNQTVEYRRSVTLLQSNPIGKYAPTRTATGWAVDEDHLITAGHFCTAVTVHALQGLSSKVISITTTDDRGLPSDPISGVIKAVDNQNDLCLLYSPEHELIPLPLLLNTKLLKVEDPVMTVGAPRSVFPVISHGSLITLESYQMQQCPTCILANLDVFSGSSGGPALWDGAVFGIVIGVPTAFQALAIIVPVERIQEFLAKARN